MNTELLDQIADTTKRTDKTKLLKQADEATREAIKWALDPTVTFGVTVDETEISDLRQDVHLPGGWLSTFYDLLGKLSRRELTGNAAKDEISSILHKSPTADQARWGARILNKDLRAGIQAKTVNKVWRGLIPEFNVALAEKFVPDKHLPVEGVRYVEPKLDGLRMVVVNGRAFTRKGHEIESVAHVITELSEYVDLTEIVFDGEIMGAGSFDEASGRVRQKDGTDATLVYHIFDALLSDDWHKQKCTEAYSKRRERINAIIKDTTRSVRIVPTERVENPSYADLTDWRDQFMREGFEGAMVKADGPYQFKRSKDMYKVKKVIELDAPVVDVYEGKKNSRNEGRLGGVIIEHDDGVRTECGSGFSDDERERFWKDPSLIVGKVIETEFQNYTEKGHLRFPIYKRIRIDKGPEDCS